MWISEALFSPKIAFSDYSQLSTLLDFFLIVTFSKNLWSAFISIYDHGIYTPIQALPGTQKTLLAFLPLLAGKAPWFRVGFSFGK